MAPGRGHWADQADKLLEPGLEQWPRMERGNRLKRCLNGKKKKNHTERRDERQGGIWDITSTFPGPRPMAIYLGK